MAQYRYRGNKHTFNLDGQLIEVDSNLEETVIRWLHTHGYSKHWRKAKHGLNVGGDYYTPDLELSVQEDKMTHRAIVEIKPALSFLTMDIRRRMVATAKLYFSDMILAYAADNDTWYRIEPDLLKALPIQLLPPGTIPIAQLADPWKVRAKSIGYHKYAKRVEWEKWPLMMLGYMLKAAIDIMKGLNKAPRPAKRSYRRKY